MKALTKGIWLWTAKAEEISKKLNLDVRAESTPAMMGYKLLGQIAPKRWLELGYVKESFLDMEVNQ